MDQAGFFVDEGEDLSDESGLSRCYGFDILQKKWKSFPYKQGTP